MPSRKPPAPSKAMSDKEIKALAEKAPLKESSNVNHGKRLKNIVVGFDPQALAKLDALIAEKRPGMSRNSFIRTAVSVYMDSI